MTVKQESIDRALAQLIVAAVAIELGIQATQVFAKYKGPSHISFARQVSMYLMHVVFQINLSRVARAFGRDRSTVSHACNVIEDCREDNEFDEKMMGLEIFLQDAPRGTHCVTRAAVPELHARAI
jgi:chromosomal replication initiation ATPase DnaA